MDYPVVFKNDTFKWIIPGVTYLDTNTGMLHGKHSSKFVLSDAVISESSSVYLCKNGRVLIDNIGTEIHNGFKIKASSDNKVVCVLYGDGDLGAIGYDITVPVYKYKDIYMYSTYIYGILYSDYFISRVITSSGYKYVLYDKYTGAISDDELPSLSESDWEDRIYAYTYVGILADDSVISWSTFGSGLSFPDYLEGKKIIKIISKLDGPAYYILSNGKAVRHDSSIPDIDVKLQGKIINIVNDYVLTNDGCLYTTDGEVVLSYIQGEVESLYTNSIVALKGGLHIQL